MPSAEGFGRNLVVQAGEAGLNAGEAFGSRMVSTIGTATKIVSGLLVAAGGAAGGYGLKMAAANEQTQISFTTMLGSAEKASGFIQEMKTFAARTPFELPGLKQAASSLLAIGIDSSKIIPIMRTLGDATAGMGTGAEGVQRATVAIQQMNAAGRITAEDLWQLRDAGIPVFELLAGATGKTVDELAMMSQNGKLGRKELEQLMNALETGRGLERFNGLMEQQSLTLSGLISTLKDTVGQGLGDMMAPAVQAIKDQLGVVNDVIADALTRVGPALATMSATVIRTLGRLVPIFAPLMADLSNVITGAVRAALPVVESLAIPLETLASAMARNFGAVLETVGPALGRVTAGLKPLVDGVAALFDLLSGRAIAGFLDALAPLVDLLSSGIGELFTSVARSVNLGPLFDSMAGAASTLIDAMTPLLQVFINFGNSMVGYLAETAIPLLAQGFTDVANALVPLMPQLAEVATNLLRLLAGGLRDVLPQLAQMAVDVLPAIVAWTNLKLAMGDLKARAMAPLIPVIGKLVSALEPVITRVIVPLVEHFANFVTALTNSKAGIVLLYSAIGVGGALFALFKLVLTFIPPLNLLGLAMAAVRLQMGLTSTAGLSGFSRLLPVLQQVAFGTNLWAYAAAALNVILSPWFLIPVAIAAIAAGIYLAYQNIQPFRDAVDAVWQAVQRAWEWFKQLFSLFWAGDWQGMADMLSGVWESVKAALGSFFAQLPGWFSDAFAVVAPIIVGFAQQVPGWLWAGLQQLGTILLGLGGLLLLAIRNAFGVVVDHWQQVLLILTAPFWAIPAALAFALYKLGPLVFEAVKNGFLWVVENRGEILAALGNWLVGVGQWIVEQLGNLGSNLLGWLQTAWAWLAANAPVALAAFGSWLAGIGGWLIGALGDLGSKLLDWLVAAFLWVGTQELRILGALVDFFRELPGRLIGPAGSLGSFLLEWFGQAFTFAGDMLATVASGLFEFFSNIPEWLLVGLSAGLSFLLTFFYNAVMTAWSALPGLLTNVIGFFQSLPSRIWAVLSGLGSFLVNNVFLPAFNFVFSTLPGLIGAVIGFFASLPGRIWEALQTLGVFLVWNVLVPAFAWVVENLPTIAGGVLDFFRSLPGRLLEGLANLGQLIWGALQSAFQWVVDNGPALIETLLTFFRELPGKIWDAFITALTTIGGKALDLGKTIWNALAGWVNDHLVRPIREFKINIGPQELTPFESFPALPLMASGGPLLAGQAAIIGEAGPELWVPSTAGRVVPMVAPAEAAGAGGGLTIQHLEVRGQDRPTDTAWAIRTELRWLSLTGVIG